MKDIANEIISFISKSKAIRAKKIGDHEAMKRMICALAAMLLLATHQPAARSEASSLLTLVSDCMLQFSHVPQTLHECRVLPNGNILIEYSDRRVIRGTPDWTRYIEIFDETGRSQTCIQAFTHHDDGGYDGYTCVYLGDGGFVYEQYDLCDLYSGVMKTYDFQGNLSNETELRFEESDRRYVIDLPSYRIYRYHWRENGKEDTEIVHRATGAMQSVLVGNSLDKWFEFDGKLMLVQEYYNDPPVLRIFDRQGEMAESIAAPMLDQAMYSCIEDEDHVYFIVQRSYVENIVEIFPFDKHASAFGSSIVQQKFRADEYVMGVARCADGFIVAVQNIILAGDHSNALRLYAVNENKAPILLLGEDRCVVHVLEADREEGQILLLREEKEHVYDLTRYKVDSDREEEE